MTDQSVQVYDFEPFYEGETCYAANDVLSIMVANISAARACVLRDLKIYISKLPE